MLTSVGFDDGSQAAALIARRRSITGRTTPVQSITTLGVLRHDPSQHSMSSLQHKDEFGWYLCVQETINSEQNCNADNEISCKCWREDGVEEQSNTSVHS